jgi:hypothetical protein
MSPIALAFLKYGFFTTLTAVSFYFSVSAAAEVGYQRAQWDLYEERNLVVEENAPVVVKTEEKEACCTKKEGKEEIEETVEVTVVKKPVIVIND